MIDSQQAIEYFATPQLTFWGWQDNGSVVAWRDGATIAFTPEIRSVLAQLAAERLPPLGAVLLVLAACRTPRDLQSGIDFRQLLELLRQLECEDSRPLLEEVVAALAVVQQAVAALCLSKYAKEDLVAAIFRSSNEASAPHNTALLLSTLDARPFLHKTHPGELKGCRHQFLYELGVLRRALDGADAQTLVSRLQTSIDSIVVAAVVESPPPQTTSSDLLRSLANDDSLAGIARLARQVLASLNLPRALSDPDELPDGGLSDITNRGSLDRLLLSELAYDDLTLSVRVALKEALYLRREAPPSTPPRRRQVLIDVGLRTWGVPRLFATAVGLAIAIDSESQFDVTVFRSEGEGTADVDFTTREGLVSQLAALDSCVHPGAALRALLATRMPDEDDIELVLITQEEVLEDAEFLRVLAHTALAPILIATVNREGHYRLLARSAGGSRLVCSATFALDEILSPEAKRTGDLLLASDPGEIPAIFREVPFPLRLSAGVHEERAWHVENIGVFSLAKDGRLLLWNNPGCGAHQLAEGLPGGHVHWCRTQAGQHYAVVGRMRQRGLFVVQIDLQTLAVEHRALQLRCDRPQGISGQGHLVFVIYEKHCEVLDANTGVAMGDPLEIPEGFAWRRDRFFVQANSGTNQSGWHALMVAGSRLCFNWVYTEQRPSRNAVTALLNLGDDGPLVVLTNGTVFSPLHQRSRTFSEEAERVGGRVAAVSRDNQWFVYQLHSPAADARRLVNVKTMAAQMYHSKANYLEPVLPKYARPRVLRHGFTGIVVNDAQQLTLISRGGERWPLALSQDRRTIELPKKPSSKTASITTPSDAASAGKTERQPVRFERQEEHTSNYDLRIARWSDGSTAVLDSRGLLHLRSSDARLPEFTIVLAEGETAGWVSDGRCWGPHYFVLERERTAPARIYRDLIREFIERLP